jgi:hypothetical protein
MKQAAQDVMKAADEALHKSGLNQPESQQAETSDAFTRVAPQPNRPSSASS